MSAGALFASQFLPPVSVAPPSRFMRAARAVALALAGAHQGPRVRRMIVNRARGS